MKKAKEVYFPSFEYTIALPSGKSLEAQVLQLLKDVGWEVSRRHPRSASAKISGAFQISQAIFCTPHEVARLVAEGRVAFGITGKDIVLEHDYDVEICCELPISRSGDTGTTGVLFTREEKGIRGMNGLRRQVKEMGQIRPITIVSEYPNLTKKFLSEVSCLDERKIQVIPCRGSAEAFVRLGESSLSENAIDYGVALTETGTSLMANGLVPITTIFESSTALIADKGRLSFNGEVVDFLARVLRGACDARGVVYLLMNAPKKNIKAIGKILPAQKSPTIQPLKNRRFCSIAAVVPKLAVNELIWRLTQLEATDFVVQQPSVVM